METTATHARATTASLPSRALTLLTPPGFSLLSVYAYAVADICDHKREKGAYCIKVCDVKGGEGMKVMKEATS